MTAKSARKSPKVETSCAYQSRRMMGKRSTSDMESGAGAAAAGVEGLILMTKCEISLELRSISLIS